MTGIIPAACVLCALGGISQGMNQPPQAPPQYYYQVPQQRGFVINPPNGGPIWVNPDGNGGYFISHPDGTMTVINPN